MKTIIIIKSPEKLAVIKDLKYLRSIHSLQLQHMGNFTKNKAFTNHLIPKSGTLCFFFFFLISRWAIHFFGPTNLTIDFVETLTYITVAFQRLKMGPKWLLIWRAVFYLHSVHINKRLSIFDQFGDSITEQNMFF